MNGVYIFLEAHYIKTSPPSLPKDMKASNDEEAFEEAKDFKCSGMILKEVSSQDCIENFDQKVYFFLTTFPKGIVEKNILLKIPQKINSRKDAFEKKKFYGQFFVLL